MDRKLNLYLKQRDPIGAASPLADRQAVARILVDRQAEAARGRYVTLGPGKAMAYERKAQAAESWIAAASPDPADYPILTAEAAARGLSVDAFAALVIAARDAWATASGQIEALAITAKAAIAAAADEAAVRAAVAGIAWPHP